MWFCHFATFAKDKQQSQWHQRNGCPRSQNHTKPSHNRFPRVRNFTLKRRLSHSQDLFLCRWSWMPVPLRLTRTDSTWFSELGGCPSNVDSWLVNHSIWRGVSIQVGWGVERLSGRTPTKIPNLTHHIHFRPLDSSLLSLTSLTWSTHNKRQDIWLKKVKVVICPSDRTRWTHLW